MTIRQNRRARRSAGKSVFGTQQKREQSQQRRLLLENLEDRRLMAVGPALAGIQPNNGSLLTPNVTLKVAPRELTFNFTNDANFSLDPTTLDGIVLRRAGFDDEFINNRVTITPGFVGLGDTGNQVVMRFASPLPDDAYRIIIVGAGTNALLDAAGNPYNGGVNTHLDFNLDLGAQVLAVVPQPVSAGTNGALTQRMRDIDVHFNDDDLNVASAQNVNFYQLIITNNTVSPVDDAAAGVIKPVSVVYDAAQNKATLTFADTLQALNPNNYALRLRIGTDEALDGSVHFPQIANDPQSNFANARNAGVLDGNEVWSDAISTVPYNIQWPGGNDDPGHRDFPRESEQHLDDGQGDNSSGTATRYYNFKNFIGFISDGRGGFQPGFNLITEIQKQRAREIFELYSRYSGIQFIESQDLGLTVATGDLRLADPEIPSAPGGVAGLGGGNLAIMDSAESWQDGYGESWFRVAMHEIGHSIGLGHTYDLAPLTIMGDDGALIGQSPGPEGVYPGDNDIVHLQRIYRPEGQDIDMYRFTIAAGQTGVFTAETFAERLQDSSRLDTYLRLYKVTANGNEEIAVNDDYFSKDSLIQLQLSEGTYFVGVTAKGNEQYDPTVPNSGMGGTSEGAYHLSLNFRPTVSASRSIVDTTGTPLDGDADGVAGGVFNFWFRTAAPIPAGATTHTAPRTLFVNRAAPSGGNGSLATPFNNIQTALNATIPGDIVRIVGNGGADDNVATLGDNLAYQIGRDQTQGAPLRDGSSLQVPKDVTVMVDAGTIFQMRNTRVQVGSSELTQQTDQSGGALQVLGVPGNNVYFTSYNDQTGIGRDTNPLSTPVQPGDWGGLLFRNDQDRADGRFDWEDRGIFLNSVNFADIRYGGGNVNLGGANQPNINPIHMVDARPTVTNNVITSSRVAAMSATPNSFAETSFREPRFQPDATYARSFNVDYTRIGP